MNGLNLDGRFWPVSGIGFRGRRLGEEVVKHRTDEEKGNDVDGVTRRHCIRGGIEEDVERGNNFDEKLRLQSRPNFSHVIKRDLKSDISRSPVWRFRTPLAPDSASTINTPPGPSLSSGIRCDSEDSSESILLLVEN